jgi:hypothetical protein
LDAQLVLLSGVCPPGRPLLVCLFSLGLRLCCCFPFCPLVCLVFGWSVLTGAGLCHLNATALFRDGFDSMLWHQEKEAADKNGINT